MRSKLLQRIAADYEGMFTSVWAAIEELYEDASPTMRQRSLDRITKLKPLVAQEIAWAKRVLKKGDKIVWWLRWLKLCLEYCHTDGDKTFEPDFRAYQAKATKGGRGVLRENVPTDLSQMQACHTKLEHLLSLPIAGIDAYQPGYVSIKQAFEDMDALEHEWQEKRKQIITPQPGDKAVLTFQDGLAWWLLDRHACQQEGDAMGNCGNMPSTDEDERILSLREPKTGADKGKWQPYLTFILRPDGQLGEMKARFNEKPEAKYHPYIVALLKSDMIKGIVGGGYAPENNFSIMDLPEEERDELYKLKPQLMTLSDYYRKNGADETFIQRVEQYFEKEHREEITWDEKSKVFTKWEWRGIRELIKDQGNDGARWALNALEDGEELYVEEVSQQDAAKSLLGYLPNPEIDKIGRILVAEHEKLVSEWLEEKGYDPEETEFDTTDEDDIVEFAIYADEGDLIGALADGFRDGQRAGAEKDIMKSLRGAIRYSKFVAEDPEHFWDTAWGIGFDVNTILKVIEQSQSLVQAMEDLGDKDPEDYVIDMSDDHDYSGFDKASARDSFYSQYDVDAKYEALFGEDAAEKELTG